MGDTSGRKHVGSTRSGKFAARKSSESSGCAARKAAGSGAPTATSPGGPRKIPSANAANSIMTNPLDPLERVKRVLSGKVVPKTFYESHSVEIDIEKEERVGINVKKDVITKIEKQSCCFGKLKSGDILVSVNGKTDHEIKNVLQQIVKKGGKATKFGIVRMRTRFVCNSQMIPKGVTLQEGFEYAVVVLYFIRGLSLGLEIITIDDRVYVEKVDPDSVAGMSLGHGDCLLDIEGNLIANSNQAHDLIKRSMDEVGFARVIVEIPCVDPTKNAIRYKLNAKASPPMDYGLPADVVEIAKKHGEWRSSHAKDNPKSIFRGEEKDKDKDKDKKKKKKNIKFSEKANLVPVLADVSQRLLVKVPPMKSADPAASTPGEDAERDRAGSDPKARRKKSED